jgi:hypothetical protein
MMPNSRWPEGALRTLPVKRDWAKTTPLEFANAALHSEKARPIQEVRNDLKTWFEDEWDGGGVTLETWDEVAVVVLALFGGEEE